MAESIGALRAEMSAGHAQFAADMGKARRAVETNATGMQRAMNLAKSGFNGAMQAIKLMSAAAIAGGAVFGKMLKDQIDMADKTAKTAQAAGTTVEVLSAMKHAADLSGVSFESLSKAFKMTAQRAADTAAGTGEAKDAYEALGISVQKQDGTLKNSQDLILEVADKFQNMEDGAGKTALAIDLFGKSGADLIPMLNQGREGIKGMMTEADQLGLVLDTGTAQAAERFNDNLTRLGGVQKGFINQVMVEMLPALEDLTNKFVNTAKEGSGLKRAAEIAASGLKILLSAGILVKTIFDALGSAIGGVAAALVSFFSGEFSAAWEIAKNVASDTKATFSDAITDIEDVWTATADNVETKAPAIAEKLAAPIIRATKTTKVEADKMKDAIEKTIEGLKAQVATLGMSSDETTIYKLSTQGATQAQLDLAESLLKTIETHKENEAALQRAQQIYDATRTSIEVYENKLLELESLLIQGKINFDTYSRAVAAAYKNINKETGEAKDGFEDLKQTIDGWGKDSAAAIVDFALTGKQAFGEMIESMIADLLKMMLYQNITGPIAGAISSGIRGIFAPGGVMGGFTSGGATVAHSGGIPGVDSLPSRAAFMLASAPRFHSGLLPGEFAAILKKGEGVFTPGQMAALGAGIGGGNNVEINVINNNGSEVSTKTKEANGGLQIDVMIDQAVAKKLGQFGSSSNKMLRQNYNAREKLVQR